METNLNYDMYVPTRVMFGAGMLNKLGEQPMPGKRHSLSFPTVNPPARTGIWLEPKSN